MSHAPQAAKRNRAKPERRPNVRLKAQRLKKNWTQVYVATMIGTSDVEVSRWETGTSEPTLYFREKLCELFGQTPEALGSLRSASCGANTFTKDNSCLLSWEQPIVTQTCIPIQIVSIFPASPTKASGRIWLSEEASDIVWEHSLDD